MCPFYFYLFFFFNTLLKIWSIFLLLLLLLLMLSLALLKDGPLLKKSLKCYPNSSNLVNKTFTLSFKMKNMLLVYKNLPFSGLLTVQKEQSHRKMAHTCSVKISCMQINDTHTRVCVSKDWVMEMRRGWRGTGVPGICLCF